MSDTNSIIRSIREIERLSRKSERRLKHKQENIVVLRLAKDDIIYERLSNYSDKKIKTEIMQYIEEQVKHIPLSCRIIIKIERYSESTIESVKIEEAIKENLKIRIIEKQVEMIHNLKESVALFVLGIVIFAIKTLINMKVNNASINEIFLIIAWVFIWRSVESIYFERRKLRIEKLKMIQLYVANYDERIIR